MTVNRKFTLLPAQKTDTDLIIGKLDGPYKTTDELTDGDIDVIITGDITVTPVFKAIGTSTQPATNATINIDNSSKSPQTGNNDVLPYTVVILSVIACGVMGAFVIKSSKKQMI